MANPLIRVSVIAPDDQGALYQAQPGVWTEYYITNSYFSDNHIYQAGIASPGGFLGASVAFFQTTAPTLLWQCDFTAERRIASPILPSPTTLLDPNWVLLDQRLEPEMIELAPNGASYIYKISGTYWFGHLNPAVARVTFPIAPWFIDTATYVVRILTSSNFQGGLIDAPA
jgi:hypothetical protein